MPELLMLGSAHCPNQQSAEPIYFILHLGFLITFTVEARMSPSDFKGKRESGTARVLGSGASGMSFNFSRLSEW